MTRLCPPSSCLKASPSPCRGPVLPWPSPLPASAQTSLARISVDNLTNSDSDHKTEVEPDMFAWGSTIVSAFHVARRPGSIGWGSGDVGYSTSIDGGKTWNYGDLPGLTVNYKGGTYGAAADPSVAYDAKHGEWLISTLPLAGLSSLPASSETSPSAAPLRTELGQSHHHRQDTPRRQELDRLRQHYDQPLLR